MGERQPHELAEYMAKSILALAVNTQTTREAQALLENFTRSTEHASIDRCISIAKSRRPYDQGLVRELEKLKEG